MKMGITSVKMRIVAIKLLNTYLYTFITKRITFKRNKNYVFTNMASGGSDCVKSENLHLPKI